ncbi:hypothetical protein [Moraxella ovis]|uniref:hypothetical protein n=1 Tax=Moraxella ovis TaxID=29433 RepID=UPI0015EC4A26|nr:hypothetical protein [Moraxella ovis]
MMFLGLVSLGLVVGVLGLALPSSYALCAGVQGFWQMTSWSVGGVCSPFCC